MGITPRPSGGEVGGADGDAAFKSDREREEWEEEQKVRVHNAHYVHAYTYM